MNQNTLIFIDGYLSNKERAETCLDLINQLKSILPYKIALINKYNFSWGLDTKVDHYVEYGHGFMVGRPPQDILDKELYELPYVYVNTGIGTMENWLPLIGVQDHVANMYNSFISTSVFAKNLGYKKIFKVEADTKFDLNELKSLVKDIDSFEDYLLYGERQEGDWAKPHHRIADMHMIGYSVDLFDGFDLVQNDSQFWKLCEKIDYYGKWIEYIIPTIIYYQNKLYNLNGTNYPGKVRERYPNTEFDMINNPGGWTEKWQNIPKPCKISPNKHSDELNDKLGLFYWNEDENPLEIDSKILDINGNKVYSKQILLNPNTWLYDEVEINTDLTLLNTNIKDGKKIEYTTLITQDNILDLNTRFIKN